MAEAFSDSDTIWFVCFFTSIILQIINFFFNLIMERSNQQGNVKVHAFNSFFYPKLIKSGYASLKRWTKKVRNMILCVFLLHELWSPSLVQLSPLCCEKITWSMFSRDCRLIFWSCFCCWYLFNNKYLVSSQARLCTSRASTSLGNWWGTPKGRGAFGAFVTTVLIVYLVLHPLVITIVWSVWFHSFCIWCCCRWIFLRWTWYLFLFI